MIALHGSLVLLARLTRRASSGPTLSVDGAWLRVVRWRCAYSIASTGDRDKIRRFPDQLKITFVPNIQIHEFALNSRPNNSDPPKPTFANPTGWPPSAWWSARPRQRSAAMREGAPAGGDPGRALARVRLSAMKRSRGASPSPRNDVRPRNGVHLFLIGSGSRSPDVLRHMPDFVFGSQRLGWSFGDTPRRFHQPVMTKRYDTCAADSRLRSYSKSNAIHTSAACRPNHLNQPAPTLANRGP